MKKMTKNYLLEVGLEEMPAHVVTPTIKQLLTKTEKFLKENKLNYKEIKTFSTPRRLALLVEELNEKQDDIDEVQKGPAKKIALDDEGNWTKAAQGFARGQNMSTDDIYFEELKGTEYAFLHKKEEGKQAKNLLGQLSEVVMSLTFPTRMHWANYDFEFIRPIHWIVSLFDDEVIPMQILDVEAGRKTRGHRFLGDPISLAKADDYEESLKSEFVIADADDRKAIIRSQIEEMAKENNWIVKLDEGLLEEVNNLVEYPTAFAGRFDKKYLEIPEEVLITSMKDHQRYFAVREADGSLSAHFISVRNGNKDHIENVALGNEKVLTARLEDADFFYKEDQKLPISHFVDKLKNVTFHDRIGSLTEKMMRVKAIAGDLAKRFHFADQETTDVVRASEIYKFDLVTQMVGEFDELQGIMGQRYAKLSGENDEVSLAIAEQYLPTSAEGKLPSSKIGALLSISEKLDTILTFFSADMIPTSSNDPYALRRSAYGIVRILVDQKWSVSFNQLLPELIEMLDGLTPARLTTSEETIKQISGFILDRVKQYLTVQNYKYDVIDTVMHSVQNDPLQVIEAAKVLNEHHQDSEFKSVVESLTRISNILQKAQFNGNESVEEALLQTDSEKQLLVATNDILSQTVSLPELYRQLVTIEPLIEAYFEENMIMDKDEAIKKNRLAQLNKLNKLAHRLGDVQRLVIK